MENIQNLEELLDIVENNSFALDSEDDKQAIQFDEIAGSIKIDLPKKILLDDTVILDQGKTMLCVAFGTTNGVNEGLKLLGFKADKNPNTLAGYIRTNLDKLIDKRGTYVINWPKGARKLGWIEGFSQVNTLYEIKKSLAFGLPIATGTNKLSWRKTAKNNFIATLGEGGGHFVSLVGYDDEKVLKTTDNKTYTGCVIVENTWGEKWGDKGRYYIPYDMVNVLFNTKKSLVINKEKNRKYATEILENLKKKIEEKKIKPVVQKYEYFDGEQNAIVDQENKNLFIVLQNAIKETGYKPIFRTIIGGNEDRTNTRLLLEISNARTHKK